MANEMAILYDATKCTACRGCQVACKEWNRNKAEMTVNHGSYENPMSLSSYTWMRILFNEEYSEGKMHWRFTKQQCMHCTEAACVEVCPSGATKHEEFKLPDGTVLKRVATNPKTCIGCNYCRVACPFDVPGYNQKEKGIFRCTRCLDRLGNAKEKKPDESFPALAKPACVNACAPGALVSGKREELLSLAKGRVAKLQAGGYPRARLYGESELGGLMYLYVLADEPESYGLPSDPSVPIGTKVWKALSSPRGLVMGGALVIALVVNGVINARNRGLEEKYRLSE